MITFIIGVAILIGGYFTYGKFVEHVFGPDDRPTPAIKNPDGVDRMVLPNWKNALIELLNIAGIGPVIGVILGIKFGAIVFIILPLGNVLGGAVHDYFSGMISMRNNGENVPTLAKKYLGKLPSRVIMAFIALALLLVGAVFVNTPALLINTPTLGGSGIPGDMTAFWIAAAVIFLYYFASTFFPIDKIIGKIYPVFGAVLILSSIAILIGLIPHLGMLSEVSIRDFASNFVQHPDHQPIIPMLFVTIACGIISGFHSTQSPIVARTEKTERTGCRTFYGMMIVEGLIGMIWAAGGMFIYKMQPDLLHTGGVHVLNTLVNTVLPFRGISALVLIGVVILAITSGDTALRSLRLTLAELFHYPQVKAKNRLILCIPIFLLCAGIIFWSNLDAQGFNVLWNYFSWANQVMAVCSLCITVAYLRGHKKNFWIALLPNFFMMFIVSTYIMWVSPANLKGAPLGFGTPLRSACIIGAIAALILNLALLRRGKTLAQRHVD